MALKSEQLKPGVVLRVPAFKGTEAEKVTLLKYYPPKNGEGSGGWTYDESQSTYPNTRWDEHYLLANADIWPGDQKSSSAEALTSERKNQHGDWSLQAEMANRLKEQLRRSPNWESMVPMQKEALDMIATKMSRIVCGDPMHEDHWDDIGGYAFLGKGGHK